MTKNKLIQLAPPQLGSDERAAVNEVIDSGWITQGPKVREFEHEFAQVHGHKDAVAVSSCTAGLHLALLALGIGPGDEVLVPSVTFVATTNAVLYVGATPVFVDIEELGRPHISIEDAESKRTERTRAVIVMHYGGVPVQMDLWRGFCDENGIALIEDAAHAAGTDGAAKLGDISTFSFFGNKNMSTAEGGMILTQDEALIDDLRCLRSHGMTTSTLDRHRGHAHSYDVIKLGLNYRLDEIRASIGLTQLRKLSGWNEKRRQAVKDYRALLADLEELLIIPFAETEESAAHLMAIVLPEVASRTSIMDELRSEGIQSSIHYPPVHQFSLYRQKFGEQRLPISEEFARRELTLPLHPGLSPGDLTRIVTTLKSTLGH